MVRLITILTILCSFGAIAAAQESSQYVLKKDQTNKRPDAPVCDCEKPKKEEKPSGPWKFKFRVGSVFQISSSRSVVGRIDGTTRSFNLDVHAEANWACGRNSVRTRLDTNDLIVKTQNTGRWVPASDFVELESIYQYAAVPTFGPFARAAMRTSIFLGRDLRTNAVQYDVAGEMLTSARTEYRLTDRFLPMTLLQSVGVFYNPVKLEKFDVDLRGGFGVHEIFAHDQLGLQDDSATKDIVELVRLHSYVEAGVEAMAYIRGVTYHDKVQYYFGGEFLLPVIRTKQPGDDRSSVDLISKTVKVGLAYQLAKSASLLYELRLVHQPQLINEVQILNNVGFKATFNIL